MRSPVFRGLLLGLFVGFVVGYFVSGGRPSGTADGAEAIKLRHQLESLRRERDGLEVNLKEFQSVAERMTEAFGVLEERFKALETRLAEEPARQSPPTPAP